MADGEPSAESFGVRLDRLLSERGLKKGALAEAVNVSANTVSNWLGDRTEPDVRTLRHMMQALGVDANELVGGSGAQAGTVTESERLLQRLAALQLEGTVRAISAVAPDLMAILSEARRQVDAPGTR